MQKTGQLLKEAREKKGLTIPEISHVTKINPKTLEALERGDISGLPQKAFVRGFVQTYAKYLGLDVNETLKLFQEEVGQTKPELPTAESLAAGTVPSNDSSGKLHRSDSQYNEDPRGKSRTWLIAIASVVLILLIGFVVQMIQKYEKESELSNENIDVAKIEATSDTTDPSSSSTSTTLLDGTSTSTTLTDLILPIVTSSSSTTSTTSTTTTTRPTTTTSTSTTRLTTTTTTTTRMTTSTTSRSTTTTRQTTTSTTLVSEKPAKNLEVIVEALDSVTLGFRIDSGNFMTLKLAPQQVHTFKAKSSLNIDVSDGGAISIIYNGQDRGAPGSLGQPIKLKYP